jgi:gluconokinase
MKPSLIVMGVAGCGKSSLGAALAQSMGVALVEGDDFHSGASREKMHHGIALTDEDRAGWLDALAGQLQAHPSGVVLTCSALKQRYRDRLRAACADVCFVFLDISMALAEARVAARGQSHFFSTSLVQSQFATLELPVGEPGVLRLDASLSLHLLLADVQAWLKSEETL